MDHTGRNGATTLSRLDATLLFARFLEARIEAVDRDLGCLRRRPLDAAGDPQTLAAVEYFAIARDARVEGERSLRRGGAGPIEAARIGEARAAGVAGIEARRAIDRIEPRLHPARRPQAERFARDGLAREDHLALVGWADARHDVEERGLAGAVRAHEPHLLAGIELKRRVDEQHLPAVLLADPGESDHRSSSPRPTRTARPPTRTRVMASASPVISM